MTVKPAPGSSRPPVPCFKSEIGRAAFSASGRYRWILERRWDPAASLRSGASLIFVGLNPSSADALTDDPTLRRLTGFARQWGYGRLVVLNLFALTTPSPALLRRHPRPVGHANNAVLMHWLRQWGRGQCWDLWLGWGAHGSLRTRDRWFVSQLMAVQAHRVLCGGRSAFCLGRTRLGHPRHPLYLPASSVPEAWIAAEPPLIRHPVAKLPASTVRP